MLPVLVVASLSACADDPLTENERAILVERVSSTVVTIGGTEVVSFDGGSAYVSGPDPVVLAGPRDLAVEYRDGDGVLLNERLAEGDFEMRVAPFDSALVTYARQGTFSGRLTPIGAGTTGAYVIIWDKTADGSVRSVRVNLRMP
jgi:hypothetical protein